MIDGGRSVGILQMHRAVPLVCLTPLLFCFFFSVAFGDRAEAEEAGDASAPHEGPAQDARQAWLQGSFATGTWGGYRPKLENDGFELFASYSAGMVANVKGGYELGVTYDGFAHWGLSLDFERLIGWSGGGLRMNWISYQGGQPSTDLVGVFPTETVDANESFARIRFFEIALEQWLFDDHLRIEVGQLTSDLEFFQSTTSAWLMNGTFGFLGIARPVTPQYPTAAPGVLLAWHVLESELEVRAAVYTADVGPDVPSNIGFDWKLGKGVSVFGELIWRPTFFGRAGTVSLGMVGITNDLLGSAEPQDVDPGVAVYGVVDWSIWDDDDGREISVFTRSFGAPESESPATRWYTSFGFGARGLLPGRLNDVLAFGFSWQVFSDAYVAAQAADGLAVSDHESILELTYAARVTGWMKLQPDLQIVLDPNLSRRDAVVLGLRAVIDL